MGRIFVVVFSVDNSIFVIGNNVGKVWMWEIRG